MKTWISAVGFALWGACALGCSSSSDDSDGGGASEEPAAGAGAATGIGSGGSAAIVPPSQASAGGSGTTGAAGSPALPVGESPDSDPSSMPETSPFVMTAHDPLSTFAADTDTASFDLFASAVARGALPDRATVRLEEFVNYFHYGYPAPEKDSPDPFAISLAAAPSLFWKDTLLLRVGIQGRLPSEKKPVNLVFLIDSSGSMADPAKLPLVKSTVAHALSVLEPSDRVSLVTYAGDTRVVMAPTPAANVRQIVEAVNGIESGGGTNGGAGLQLAYDQARLGFLEGAVNHVILCTDGDFNLGISSTDALLELITEQRKSGVTFTALGFGSSPNDSMMEKVSNAGNGTYAIIYSEAQAKRYAEERLLANLEYIAKDVKIQVEFNAEKVSAYRLLGYEDRAVADEDFRDDVVDAGEVGAGHRVTAIYQLVLTGNDIPAPESAPPALDGDAFSGDVEVNAEDYALVKVRYKQPEATEKDPAAEVSARLGAAEVAEGWEALDTDFQWAFAIASYAEILKQSPYADERLLTTIGLIVNRPVAESDRERLQFQELFAQAEALIAARK